MASEVRQLDLVLNLKDQASKELGTFSSKLESMQPAFQKMAIAGTAAFIAIGAGIGKTVKDAVNLGESVNAVQVIFGEGAKNILKFGENSAKAVGMATAEFNQMASITGALLKDTGKPLTEVADMTVTLTQRAADMASVFNTDVNDAMSAINQAIRGETEAIRRYAGDVTDATLETYALSKGIKTHVADMTQQEKRLLRVDLILEQTKVTANDFANTSESLANQQRVLSAEFTNISATIGNAFIPVLTNILTTIKPIIQDVAEWIKQHPELTKNILLASLALAGLVAVLGTLGLVLPPVITAVGILVGAASLPALAAAFALVAAVLSTKAIIEVKNMWRAMEDLKSTTQKNIEANQALQNKINGMEVGPARDKLQQIHDENQKLLEDGQNLAERYSGLMGIFNSISDWWGDKMNQKAASMAGQKDIWGREISVNDAIITPQGDVIKTDPADFLIATKTPGALAGGGSGGVNVVINYPFVLDRNGGDMLADVISNSLRNKLRI